MMKTFTQQLEDALATLQQPGTTELDLSDGRAKLMTVPEIELLIYLSAHCRKLNKLDLSQNELRGVRFPDTRKEGERKKEVERKKILICSAGQFHAGELPLAIGQLKANGCEVELGGNKGFTLSSDISSVMHATKLDFRGCRGCYFSGVHARYAPSPAKNERKKEVRKSREKC